jgi:hypothetical protein
MPDDDVEAALAKVRGEIALEKALAQLRSFIKSEVEGGFTPLDDIAESAAESFDGDQDVSLSKEDLQFHAQRLLDEAVESHRQRQQEWPEVTDCDRLDAAFSELEKRGIVSRQDFTCCSTCGAAEIWDEMKEARENGRQVKGYTFYHMQDTEAAIEGDGICLSYGSVIEGEEEALIIGREVVSTLDQHGLRTEWDGTFGKKICVSVDWKRRRRS